MKALWSGIFKRDLALAFRQRSELAQPLMFLLMVVTLFPLGVGPGPATLQKIGPGVIWIAAILSSLLAMDRMFRDDFWDGSMEQYLLSGQSVWAISAIKVLVHWLVSFVPLLILSPLLALFSEFNRTDVHSTDANAAAGYALVIPGWGDSGWVDGWLATGRGVTGSIADTGVYSVVDFCHLGG